MRRARNGTSFLSRLARDIRGNTLMLAAAAMLPLCGMIGGGVDMSRLYLTKTRMQQACDAGALAGRKAMGAGAWTTGTDSTASKADDLFKTNFLQGAYGTGLLTTSFTEQDGAVNGLATVVVPMTIMRIFGATPRTLAVHCTAKMEIPNSDVMFVLDVTGSMNCVAGDPYCGNNGNVPATGSKIDGLKSAIKCFYEALERVNTSEVCGNDPTATTASTTAQIRLGFVPYTVDVNVGRLLPNSYMANSWNYQTRHGVFYTTGAPTTGAFNQQQTFSKSRDCRNWATGTDTTGFPSDSQTPNSFTASTTSYTEVGYDSHSNQCTRRVDQSTVTYTRDDANGTYFHTWIYEQAPIDVSGLKAGGSNWNNSLTLPIGSDGTPATVAWNGCIEERQTFQNTNGNPSGDWNPIPASAYDMNIDMVPNASDPTTQWGPMLPDAVWGRYSGWNNTLSNVTTSSDLSHNMSAYCPTPSRKLQVYSTAAPLEAYVNSLTAIGNTYHDIGLIWGARLLSPTGIFASENATTPTGGAIQRNLIFMTDGDTSTSDTNYGAYGVTWWDRRQTNYDPSSSQLDAVVNARTDALCTAIKNKNITLWVISYGGGINPTTESRLQACATSGHYFAASSSADLISRFRQIAAEIAELRLTN